LQQFIRALFGFLPFLLRTWLDSIFPEWNLPSCVIVKKQKQDWEEEFDLEKANYARLRPLQGTVIPELFAELGYDNARALLLSDIGCVCLATPEGALLDIADSRRLLRQVLTALSQFGILQEDIKLDNFHLTGDRIMVVDLENLSMEELLDKQLEFGINSTVNILAKRYEDNQLCFLEDGLLVLV